MDVAAAKYIFKVLDTNGNKQLDANEVTPTEGCSAVKGLVGLNRDEFIASLSQRGVSDTLLKTAVQAMHEGLHEDAQHTVGARLVNIGKGTLCGLVGIFVSPISLLLSITTLFVSCDRKESLGLFWFGFCASGDFYGRAFAKGAPSDPGKV